MRFAEEGDVNFCFRAGYCYSNGKGVAKDLDKAIYWYTKAAEKRDKYAQHVLGEIYFHEKKDYSKAKYWWEKSAAQGHSIAKSDLELYFSPKAVARRQAKEKKK